MKKYNYYIVKNLYIIIIYMNKFISLGRYCNVSFNIRKYVQPNSATNFFDWQRTDFKAVIDILNTECIDEIFNIENIVVDDVTYRSHNDLTLTLKNFNEKNLTLLFHHDIRYDDNREINVKLNEFIDKYKRRFYRLIDIIKNDNENKIFICRIFDNFDYENDIKLFDKILRKHNENINYILVLLSDDVNEDYYYVRFENYLKINIAKYTDFTKNTDYTDWTSPEIEWEKIFNIIQTII